MKVVIRLQEAAEYCRDVGIPMSVETLSLGIQQGVFPFGDYIAGAQENSQPRCLIYTKLLMEWAMQRSPYAKEHEIRMI